MCGIAGIYTGRRENLARRARAAVEIVSHRGPDSVNIAYSDMEENPAGFYGALALARLATVDVNGPAPPIESGDGRFCAALNGEIWNYRSLRDRLTSRGFPFRTAGDTEVALQSVADEGARAPARFKGQFAYVVEDRREGILHAGRDPHGICPLFYGWNGQGEFILGSTIGVLLQNAVEPSGIRAVPQGYTLVCHPKSGAIDFHRYYDIGGRIPCGEPAPSTETIREVLFDAIREKIPDEVDYVTMLGGMDSSLVTVVCASCPRPPKAVITVSTTEDRDSSDMGNAGTISEKFGLQSRIGIIDEAYIGSNLERVVANLGSANYLSVLAGIAGLKAAEMAREVAAKVILTGGGADEIFGGYEFVWNLFDPKRVEANLLHLYRQSGVFECHREDGVTAAVGIEARPAYYDTGLAEMVLSTPVSRRISGLGTAEVNEKALLKEIARGYLPGGIIRRKKSPLYRSTSILRLFEKVADRMITNREAEEWRAQALRENPSWLPALAMSYKGPVLIHRTFSSLFPGCEKLPLPWGPPDYEDPDSYGRFHGFFGSPCLEGFVGVQRARTNVI
ncbi:MAG: hypothetical protein FJ122_00655 [Deltaproteobacteria bacterium]|nr:hypothetical protein [Deltaproteobacteria bacterium]